jgi:Heterokaryon incompatibility protein (HET)
LLHVGSSKSPDMKLCKVPDGTSYASLSHCWGAHVPVKLLASNLSTFEHKIEISELPKTFREAIDVVRRLDIEYIWIDSLCIIQDSKDDWAKEAALMHQVYSNAAVNIAADDAKDGTDDLFRERDPRLCEPLEVKVEWTKEHRGTYFAVDNALWQTSIETSVLNSRAWVLQEQLLSRRILHFGRMQLLWECQTGKACELFPEGLYEGHTGYGPKNLIKKIQAEEPFIYDKKGDLSDERVVVEFSQRYEAHQQWNEIVDNYTNRHLTFGSDKLVAISALARKFQKTNLESEYLAGLWREDLAAQLLWSPARLQLRSRPTTRQTEFRAPTWSWASIDGRILAGTPGLNPKPSSIQIKIHEVSIDLACDDPFGSASGGRIIVSGRLAQISLAAAGEAANLVEGTASYYLKVLTSSRKLSPMGLLVGQLQLALKDFTYENGSIALRTYEDIFFIPVTDEHDGGRRGKLGSAGLLLQREWNAASSFRRFGMYHCHMDDMPLFEQGYNFFDSMAGDTGLEFYEDDASHKTMYKITIV